MCRLERLLPKAESTDVASRMAAAFEVSAAGDYPRALERDDALALKWLTLSGEAGGTSRADRLVEAAGNALPAEQAVEIERAAVSRCAEAVA